MAVMNNIRPNALTIIKKGESILAQKGSDKDGKVFYRLLGGGIEFGELAPGALKREIKEELGATIINERFLCVIENIFEFNGKPGHEITFLFQADLSEESLYLQKEIKIIDKEDSYAEWVDIQNIKNGGIILYPQEAVSYL